MAQVVVREVVSVPPWYTTANSAASLSSDSFLPAQAASIPLDHHLMLSDQQTSCVSSCLRAESASQGLSCDLAWLSSESAIIRNAAC